jgi:hypothetical protein
MLWNVDFISMEAAQKLEFGISYRPAVAVLATYPKNQIQLMVEVPYSHTHVYYNSIYINQVRELA